MPVPDPDHPKITADKGWSRLMRALGVTTPKRLREIDGARAGIRSLRQGR